MARVQRVLLVRTVDGASTMDVSGLRARTDALDLEFVDSLEQAHKLVSPSFAAVIVGGGHKQLRLAWFAQQAAARAPGIRLLLLDDDAPGYVLLPGADGRRLVDEVLGMLGVARSVFGDVEVVEQLGSTGLVDFARVAWPGAPEPLVRTSLLATPSLVPLSLERALRGGVVAGPGLAPTLETFWDDPRPHALQEVPPGLSLRRLLWQREWGAEVGLSVARGLVDGLGTLHAAGFSCGPLEGPSVWVSDEGGVTLLGHALLQLPYRFSEYFGLPEEAPPEEYGQRIDPMPQGDAFRLALLVLRLAFNLRPFAELGPTEYLAREWRPALGGHERQLGERGQRLVELCLAPWDTDRPRGALLKELVSDAAPRDWRGVLRDAVKTSRSLPPNAR